MIGILNLWESKASNCFLDATAADVVVDVDCAVLCDAVSIAVDAALVASAA